MDRSDSTSQNESVEIDVIVPVYNAAATLRETISSAMRQVWTGPPPTNGEIVVYVCCYDDASTDESWSILLELEQTYRTEKESHVIEEPVSNSQDDRLESHLVISTAPEGSCSRGAGYARNRAVELRSQSTVKHRFLCWLDSDDIMHPTRIYHQVTAMLDIANATKRQKTLLGCQFDRIPSDATWHYTQWANKLTDKRLALERFREVTVIQPTWMMCRERFEELGGYLEAPQVHDSSFSLSDWLKLSSTKRWRLVHAQFETPSTLRVAEDLRFFHEHLYHENGRLQLCRTAGPPFVSYRHRVGQSQCALTPRKLLLHLRVAALEKTVLSQGHKFVVWGAGRDGKDFVKALSPGVRQRLYCMVDVDEEKIARGFYEYRTRQQPILEEGWKIPIVHFSLLCKRFGRREVMYRAWKHYEEDEHPGTNCDNGPVFGRIDKSKTNLELCSSAGTPDRITASQDDRDKPTSKKRKLGTASTRHDPGLASIDIGILPELPVVVCVAMYRTKGALEKNVGLIERNEGIDLWHFS
jgi:Glycosyl transferase family 2